MVPYQINMALGHVPSLASRRCWRRWIAAYFLLVISVLGVSVGLLTRTGIGLVHQQERIVVRERELLDQRSGVTSVEDHMRQLSREMAVSESQLGALEDFGKKECRAGSIILGLANVMPAGMDLGQVSVDGAAAKLGCEVYVPVGLKIGESISPPHLISLWSGEALLTGRVKRFTSEKSERIQVDGQEVMNWRFSGVLGGGNK